MPDDSNVQSNNCAYCLKPVIDNFICADCIKSKNVLMEGVAPPSEAATLKPAAERMSVETKRSADKDGKESVKQSEFQPENKNWKSFPLHEDFRKVGQQANLITYGTLLPVAGVGFALTSLFGFPTVLAACIAVGMGFGWVVYRNEQIAWYHYASWVYNNGQTMECHLDLVSSGELDQPYVVLKGENRITRIHETRAFKLVSGDVSALLSAVNAPGRRTSHVAFAHYDKTIGENAVVFKIGNCLLWCKGYVSRGI